MVADLGEIWTRIALAVWLSCFMLEYSFVYVALEEMQRCLV